jgi:hypothetical protein
LALENPDNFKHKDVPIDSATVKAYSMAGKGGIRPGAEVGTGNMACSSGISIEALLVCRWSGRHMDYDEIFRKEDGNHRMLLSF